MSKDFRFKLDRTNAKHLCPACGKKRFVRFVDAETMEYLPEQYGRCDRIDHCGYYLSPYKDGYVKSIGVQRMNYYNPSLSAQKTAHFKQTERAEPACIPYEILRKTISNGYDQNTFIQNLLHRVPFPFDRSDVEKVIALYGLGSVVIGYRAGSVTFPFIDEKERVRTIQVKQFDQANHTIATDSLPAMIAKQYSGRNESTVGWPMTGKYLPAWLEAYQKNELKVSCLFGAHLLSKYPSNRIALVEAPKTAIYGTLYFGIPEGPNDFLWLAVYSKDTLTTEKCKALAGRIVYLFPDLSPGSKTFIQWKERAAEIMKAVPGIRIVVSDLLEKLAGREERENGFDIADYLIKLDWREFRKPDRENIAPPAEIQKENSKNIRVDLYDTAWQTTNIRPAAWDQDIKELETFFKISPMPFSGRSIVVSSMLTVTDIKRFVDTELEVIRAQNGNPSFIHYLNRVKELRGCIEHYWSQLHE